MSFPIQFVNSKLDNSTLRQSRNNSKFKIQNSKLRSMRNNSKLKIQNSKLP